MTTENQLLEQHIREYQSRMQHIDELMGRVEHKLPEPSLAKKEHATLQAAQRERERLATLYEELKLSSTAAGRKEEIIKSGPMGVWDALAQQLEQLLERLER